MITNKVSKTEHHHFNSAHQVTSKFITFSI